MNSLKIIDMRWGIKGHGKKLNKSSEFCLNEIETCYNTSAGPCFIVTFIPSLNNMQFKLYSLYISFLKALVGQRYGSSFLPIEINVDEFLKLKNEMIRNRDIFKFEYKNERSDFKIDDIVDHCYKLDTNVTPSVYRLVDMDEILSEISYVTHTKKNFIILKFKSDSISDVSF